MNRSASSCSYKLITRSSIEQPALALQYLQGVLDPQRRCWRLLPGAGASLQGTCLLMAPCRRKPSQLSHQPSHNAERGPELNSWFNFNPKPRSSTLSHAHGAGIASASHAELFSILTPTLGGGARPQTQLLIHPKPQIPTHKPQALSPHVHGAKAASTCPRAPTLTAGGARPQTQFFVRPSTNCN